MFEVFWLAGVLFLRGVEYCVRAERVEVNAYRVGYLLI